LAVDQILPNSISPAAVADGSYPGVFANDTVDGNFGITAPIELRAYDILSCGPTTSTRAARGMSMHLRCSRRST
jgi:hypothetical protein